MNTSIFVVGLIILIVGIIPYALPSVNSYSSYAPYLIIAGVVIMIIGAIIPSVRTSTVESDTNYPRARRYDDYGNRRVTRTVVEEE